MLLLVFPCTAMWTYDFWAGDMNGVHVTEVSPLARKRPSIAGRLKRARRGAPARARGLFSRPAIEGSLSPLPPGKLHSSPSQYNPTMIAPILGQGTWYFGEHSREQAAEVAALRLGLDLGLTLIDTAEMYANGGAETVVGEALQGRRDEVFLVSKVLPENASARGTLTACRAKPSPHAHRSNRPVPASLARQPSPGRNRGRVRITRAAGKIRHWGVSNFDVDDMEELVALDGGDKVASNQVLYNLSRRGIEWDLLPWSRQRRIPSWRTHPSNRVGSSPTRD